MTIVSATLPPTPGGISDHSGTLINIFENLGYEVSVLTSKGEGKAFADTGVIIRDEIQSNWGLREISKATKIIIEEKPDLVWIQWQPFFYTRRGLNVSVPFIARNLNRAGIRILTYSHELWVPYDRPQFFISGPVQRLALRILIQESFKTLVSVEAIAEFLRKRYPTLTEKIVWVPIYSSIPVVKISESRKSEIRQKLGLIPGRATVAVFGPFGSGKDENGLRDLMQNSKIHSLVQFLIIGTSEAEFLAKMELSPAATFKVLGYLDRSSVSEYFSVSDIGLSLFTDGVSSRRSSFIAMASHSLPVLTNAGLWTDSCFLNEYPSELMFPQPLNQISDSQEGSIFEKFKFAIQNNVSLSDRVREFFERYYSTDKITTQIQGIVNQQE